VSLAFFGTSEFGAAVLRSLVERSRVEISTVVSQPDRASGRGRKSGSPPVADAARELGIELQQPQDASASPPDAEAGIVVAFGQILRDPLLTAYALYNLHPSHLPRWRGAAPVERAIMAGDAETAVAVIGLVADLDAGPVYGMEPISIGPHDDAGAVRAAALELGVPLLEEAAAGRLQPHPQAADGVTYAHKLSPEDRLLDWSRPAVELDRRVRALSPHIGAQMRLDDRDLTVWVARPLDEGPAQGAVEAPLVIGCGTGALEVLELQPSGGRRMLAVDYLRGLRAPPQRAA
jgi:methionyl-tRNA formyltransferase